jgi:TP901 family phage tail tape measure protein
MAEQEMRKSVVLQVDAPSIKGNGLAQTVALLGQIEARLKGINSTINGLSNTGAMSRGQILGKIQEFGKKAGGLNPEKVGELFGLSKGDISRAVAAKKEELNKAARELAKEGKRGMKGSDMFGPSGDFKSAPLAADFIKNVIGVRGQASRDVLKAITGAQVTPEQLAAGAAKAAATGPGVQVSIEGGQVVAKVVGPIVLEIPASQIVPSVQGSSSNIQGSSKPRSSNGIKSAPYTPGGANELGRVVTETEKATRTTVTEAAGVGTTIARTYDELNNELKRVTRTGAASTLQKNLRERQAAIMESFRGEKSGIGKGDFLGLARLQERMANELEGLLTEDMKKALGAKALGGLEQKIAGRAKTLRSQAAANLQKEVEASREAAAELQGVGAKMQEHRTRTLNADEKRASSEAKAKARVRKQQQRLLEQVRNAPRDTLELEKVMAYGEALRAQRGESDEANARRFAEHRAALHAKQQRTMTQAMQAATPPNMVPAAAKPGFGQQIGAMFAPERLALNFAKITSWAAGAGALYGSLNLAKKSLDSFMESGLQMARLDQVFRGVGGSSRELTDDVMGLAVAERRSREEALESAISWSRLGLTRRQVDQAVKVSLMAANVAEMDAAEATTHLQSVMAAYGLTVGDLEPLLGKLNAVSNTFNVTNKDMLTGLSRVASVAKQAGLPLEELIGLIGAGVGTTGQTGANIGNMLKSVMVGFSNPAVQDFLRNRFKMEVTSGGGNEIKNMSQVLGELWVTYQKLNSAERQSLLMRVAGKTQASRLAAVLDSYTKAQALAINQQLNLNSAEMEDIKIKGSLRRELEGLKAAAEKSVFSGGKAGGIEGILAGGVRGLTSYLNGLGMLVRLYEKIEGMHIGGKIFNMSPTGVVFNKAMGMIGPGAGKMGGGLMGALGNFLYPEVAGEVRMERLEKAAQRQKGIVGAATEAITLFGRAKQALRNAGMEDRGKIIGSLSEVGLLGDAKGFKGAMSGASARGDFGGMDAILDKQIERFKGKRSEAMGEFSKGLESLRKEKIMGYVSETDPNRRKALGVELEEMRGKHNQLLQAINDDTDAYEQFQEVSQHTLTTIERTKMAMEGIRATWQSLPAETMTQRLGLDVGSLKEMETYLGRVLKQLDDEKSPLAQSLPGNELVTVREDIRKRLRETRAEMGARGSDEAQALAQRMDRGRIARELAESDESRFDFGEMRVDQLNNRLGGINKLIQAREREAQAALTLEQKEIAINQLYQLRADKIRVALELERERGRLVQEEFEFSRRLLTAGPAELLQKMIAQRLVNSGNGLSGGRFMSYSTGLREDVLEAEQSRRRRGFLSARPNAVDFTRELIGLPKAAGGGGLGGAGTEANGIQRFQTQANAAAIDLGKLQGTAAGAGAMLGWLQGQVGGLGAALARVMEKIDSFQPGNGGTGAPYLPQADNGGRYHGVSGSW